MFRTVILAALSTLLFSGPPLAAAGKLEVSSPAFSEGKSIPKKYTGAGDDVSPPLKWGKVPAGTKSIAVICDDPDAPKKTWVHWVLFNLPPDTKELPEGVEKKKTLSSKAKQGKNDMKKIGYNGPYPPKGKAHHYHFKVYALDKKLSLKAGSTKKKLLANMKGHILAEGQLIGTFKR
jgi:Raf kinase inhibitor-like YbhB/YbcL family protein